MSPSKAQGYQNDTMLKFLYAIIQQVDTRGLDWEKVAKDIGVPTAAAARMRLTRFRNAMEAGKETGSPNASKAIPKATLEPKSSKTKPASKKRVKEASDDEAATADVDMVKTEYDDQKFEDMDASEYEG